MHSIMNFVRVILCWKLPQTQSMLGAHIYLGCSKSVEVQEGQGASHSCTQDNWAQAAQRICDALRQAYQIILQHAKTHRSLARHGTLWLYPQECATMVIDPGMEARPA